MGEQNINRFEGQAATAKWAGTVMFRDAEHSRPKTRASLNRSPVRRGAGEARRGIEANRIHT